MVADRLAVHGRDDIILFQPGLLGGASGLDGIDHGALARREVEELAGVLVDRLGKDADAQPAPDDLALVLELEDDFLSHVRGDGEADADAPAAHAPGQDVAVDADDLALHVDERPAGVAPVDGRVGLDEVLVVVVAQAELAALGADDPRRDGVLHAEGIADGQDPFSDLDLGRVAELGEGGGLGFDLDQGDVGLGVGPDDLGRIFVSLDGEDLDLLGVLDDVVVGQDVAVGADEEARSLHGRLEFLGPLARAAEEALPEVVAGHVVRHAHHGLPLDLLAFDLDHGRSDLVRDLDEIEVGPGLGSLAGEEPVIRGRRIEEAPRFGLLVGEINEDVPGQQDAQGEAGQ